MHGIRWVLVPAGNGQASHMNVVHPQLTCSGHQVSQSRPIRPRRLSSIAVWRQVILFCPSFVHDLPSEMTCRTYAKFRENVIFASNRKKFHDDLPRETASFGRSSRIHVCIGAPRHRLLPLASTPCAGVKSTQFLVPFTISQLELAALCKANPNRGEHVNVFLIRHHGVTSLRCCRGNSLGVLPSFRHGSALTTTK